MKNCRCGDYGVAHGLCSSRLNSHLFCEIYNVVTILSRTVCCQSALVLKLLACTASVMQCISVMMKEQSILCSFSCSTCALSPKPCQSF